MGNHSPQDIVVIGASAGGVESLIRLNKAFPKDFSATVFVVVHFPSFGISVLPDILDRAGNLPAKHAEEGESFSSGKIYVAPPNSHLAFKDHTLILDHGPREHGFRPAIDPLFRSAAEQFGSKVIGVILSGTLSDGVSGLLSIKRAGGIAIVQDPMEALFPDLPVNAIENVDVDFILNLRDIAARLVDLSRKSPLLKESVSMENNENHLNEFVQEDIDSYVKSERTNHRTVLTCPECGGVMWEQHEGNLTLFRCHVGHSYSTESYLAEQDHSLEAALWTAVRALEERSALLARLSTFSEQRGNQLAAQRFKNLSLDVGDRADTIRQVINKNLPVDLENGVEQNKEVKETSAES